MREPILPELDANEFLSWERRQPGKFELHEGFIIAFAGTNFRHDRIARNLTNAFERCFPAPCETFTSDMKIRVSEKTFYYCDAGVVCTETSDDALFLETPRVVAEILSPNRPSYDLVEKRAAYRRLASLEAYVVVHTEFRRIEVDTRYGDGWHITAHDEGSVHLGTGFTIDEVYARTDLERRS